MLEELTKKDKTSPRSFQELAVKIEEKVGRQDIGI